VLKIGSVGLFPPFAQLFLLKGYRRSVLCLRHPGMIAPIPGGESRKSP